MTTIFCIWIGLQVRHAREQLDLRKAIEKVGGQPNYDYELARTVIGANPEPPGPAWLRELIGIEYFAEIEGVFFWDATDEHIKIFEGHDGVRSINFMAGDTHHITDDGLHRLGELSHLDDLAVQGSSEITDEGLRHLGRLKKLKHLALNFCTQLSDRGLVHLKQLDDLEFLMLNGTQVTPVGIADLQKALPHCQIDFQTK